MNRTTSTIISILAVLTLTFENYFVAGASTVRISRNQQSGRFQQSLLMTGGPLPFGQTTIGWSLTFADEFSGTTLDLTKWRPNWKGPDDTTITNHMNSAEISCYDPKQATVNNGELDLTAVKRACLNYNYASGLIQTNGKFNFTYGYVEARIWTPAGTGAWPAFWTDGQNWPTDGEIDILEAYGTDRSTFHYHYAGCGGNCGPGGEVNIAGATTGWHVYAADWEPGSVTWYYDGQQVWKYTANIVAVPHFLIVNLALNVDPPTVPATLRVDYVRVWKSVAASPTPITTQTSIVSTTIPTFTSTSTPTSLPATATATVVPTQPTATMTASRVPSSTNTLTTEVVIDDKNLAFTFSSGWRAVAETLANNGSYMLTDQKGASVTLPFTGHSFSIIYTGDPNFRSIQVYVDNILAGTINEKTKRLTFKKRWDFPGQLTFGSHTLKLVFVAGKKPNTQASVDAVIVR